MNTRPTLLKLFGEDPFLPEESTFAIGRTESPYDLQFSVDCKGQADPDAHWDSYLDAPCVANKPVFITIPLPRVWWRLKNNTGKFSVRF